MTIAPVCRFVSASLRLWLTWPLLLLIVLTASASFSQTDRASSPNGRAVASAPTSGWAKLTPQQKNALRPLAKSWDSLSAGQQRKWLEVSRNYPSLPAADRANMHSRMAEWGALSNRERAEARLNFATTTELAQELTPQEKKAKWEAYQSLSAAEKKKLADKNSRPPVGAATAIRPVAPQKLVTLPTPANTASKPPKIPVDSSQTNGATAHGY